MENLHAGVYSRVTFRMMHETIKLLRPKISIWKACSTNDISCWIQGAKGYTGNLRVPSDYDDPEGETFNIQVQKFISSSDEEIPISKHILLLAGGPGQRGIGDRAMLQTVEYLLKEYPEIAVYMADHRGMGRSGELVSNRVRPYLSRRSKFDEPPFDFEHLQFGNAAYDVGMIIEGLMRKYPYDEFSVCGISYGAQLAAEVVARLPNLLHNVFLAGFPGVPSLGVKDDHQGLVEHCERDKSCRRLLGGNVKQSLDDALNKITQKPFNECTRIFFSNTGGLEEDYNKSQKTVMYQLVYRLNRLLDNSVKVSEYNLKPVQLAIAVIMSTAHCRNPDEYFEDVMLPMLPFLARKKSTKNAQRITNIPNPRKPFSDNEFVFNVISWNTDFNGFERSELEKETYIEHDNLSQWQLVTQMSYNNWRENTFPTTYKKELSTRNIINTSKTNVYFMQGMLDLITPYGSAYKYYEEITAASKSWVVLENAEHEFAAPQCFNEWIGVGLGFTKETSFIRCLLNAKERYKLDWNFIKNPEYQTIWKQVNSLERIPRRIISSSIPDYILNGATLPNLDIYNKIKSANDRTKRESAIQIERVPVPSRTYKRSNVDPDLPRTYKRSNKVLNTEIISGSTNFSDDTIFTLSSNMNYIKNPSANDMSKFQNDKILYAIPFILLFILAACIIIRRKYKI